MTAAINLARIGTMEIKLSYQTGARVLRAEYIGQLDDAEFSDGTQLLGYLKLHAAASAYAGERSEVYELRTRGGAVYSIECGPDTGGGENAYDVEVDTDATGHSVIFSCLHFRINEFGKCAGFDTAYWPTTWDGAARFGKRTGT